jgi:uncharacterized protein with HEPN domain
VTQKDRRAVDWLEDMLECIRRIERYTDGMAEAGFMADALVQDGVIRNFEVIGEAAHNLLQYCPDLVAAQPDIPWAVMYRMRNQLAHGYYTVDLNIVWTAIRDDVPALASRLQSLIAVLPQASPP